MYVRVGVRVLQGGDNRRATHLLEYNQAACNLVVVHMMGSSGNIMCPNHVLRICMKPGQRCMERRVTV